MQGWLSIVIMVALGAGFALGVIILSSFVGPGAPVFDLAGDVRSGMLRDRDDGDELFAIRHRAVWRGSVPRQPATIGFDDRGRSSLSENGAGAPAHLRSDARAQMGDLDGRVRL